MKRFPLIHIRDEAHLDEAIELLSDLLRQERDQGTQEYLDVLTDLVAAYEDEHVPMPDVSEAHVLRELMRSNRLSQMQLAKAVGMAQSTVSAVLTGAARSPRGRSSSSPSSSALRRQPFFREIPVMAPGNGHRGDDRLSLGVGGAGFGGETAEIGGHPLFPGREIGGHPLFPGREIGGHPLSGNGKRNGRASHFLDP